MATLECLMDTSIPIRVLDTGEHAVEVLTRQVQPLMREFSSKGFDVRDGGPTAMDIMTGDAFQLHLIVFAAPVTDADIPRFNIAVSKWRELSR